MRLKTLHIYICWLTILLFAIPAFANSAQTMAATPSSLQLTYQPGGGYTDSASTEITSSSGAITNLKIKQITFDPIGGKNYQWFRADLIGATLSIAPELNALSAVSTLCAGSCTYNASVVLSATDMQDLTVSVTLQIGTSFSLLSASPSALSFSTVTGTLSKDIALSGGTATTFTAVATSDFNWLRITSASGSIPGTLTTYADSTGLQQGTYNGSITITPNTGNAITIFATLAVGTTSTLTASTNQLNFSYQVGTTPPGSQQFTINGPAGTSFTYAASANWIGVTPSGSTLPATLNVTVDPVAAGGSTSGTITITAGAQTAAVTVTLTTSVNPILVASPTQITLNYLIGSTIPTPPTIYVSTSNNTAVPFMAYSNVSWLTMSLTSGTTPGTVAFTVNPTGYAAGAYNGAITLYNTAYGTSTTVPVTLNVSGSGYGYGTQSFYTSPSSVAFSYQGGTNPANQTINVTSVTGLPILFSATATSTGWLSVTPSTAYTPGSLSVAANPSGLSAGTYNGTIAIAGYGTVTATQTIAVTLTVTQSAAITVSPASLSFNYQSGDSVPASQSVTVGSSTSQSLSYSTSVSNSWITATASGSTPGTLQIGVSPASLSPGTYNGTVTITSASATNSPQTVKVTLVVAAPPTVSASPTSLSYSYRMDGSAPGSQSVQVTSSGAALSYTASSSANWLSVSPASGSTPATLTVSANTANLNPGSYNGTVTVNARTAGGATSTQSIAVTLTVSGPLPTITSVRNGASQMEDGVSPGEVVVIRGTAIGPSDREEAAPTSAGYYASDPLGNTRVLFNGTPAPMLYAQSDEVSAVVPYAMGDRSNTFVQVEYRGVRSNAVTMAVVKSNIGLYTADKSGAGQGMAINGDGSANSSQNPAAKGSVIMLFATGEGQITPAVADGTIPTGIVPQPVLPVSVQIGGVPVPPGDLIYIGTPPGQVAGMFQVSAKIPLTVASGPVPVTLTVGSSSSQPGVVISVK